MRPIDGDAFAAEWRRRACEDCERRKGEKNGRIEFIYEIGDAPCRACWVDDMLDEIENAPSLDLDEKRAFHAGYEAGKRDAMRWIPVGERLPKIDKTVAVVSTVAGEAEIEIASHNGEYWEDDYGRRYPDGEITHWCSLPEMPEVEG